MKSASKKQQGTRASRPRPILMIPLRRCGSHALRLRLNFNPKFYAPYPLHIVDFMPLVELYGDLSDDRNYFQLVVDVIGLQTMSMVKWPGVAFDPVDVFESIKDETRSVHRVLWELLLRAGESKGAEVVMDKSLDSVHYADHLLSLFPDMRFLNVVRDPRAQIASMNRAIIHDFHTYLNARTWVDAHDTAQGLAKRFPDRMLTIRFEDFVADQEITLRRICQFFGIEFLPEMLDVDQSVEAQSIARLSALWESNASKPIPANVDKFKKLLSPAEIEVIETLAGEHMDRYGYERMTPGRAVLDRTFVDGAAAESDRGRSTAWEELRVKKFQDYALRRQRADYIAMVRERRRGAAPRGGNVTSTMAMAEAG